MSNIYVLEPPTNAKVILHTTAGDVEIELWGKETPMAVRNFIQLCMEGYYDNTIFHRIVPNFIIQGGDPTGTGHGGESIYDDGFPNEYHSRLRFVRRGLVGMATMDSEDENRNGSQFFITLDRADELTKTHTLFGRVAGDTIFNVLKMAEMEVDENERPLYPPRIKSTEIVENPFDDIVPRITERERQIALERERQAAAKLQKKTVGKRQLNLLSFGDEAADLVPEEKTSKMKSSYDFLPDAPKQTISLPSQPKTESSLPPNKDKQKAADVPVKESPQERPVREKEDKPVSSSNNAPAPPAPKESSRREEIEKLKNDIRNIGHERDKSPPPVKKKKVSLIEQERAKYARRGNAIVGGIKARNQKSVDDTFSSLLAFQKKLASAAPEKSEPEKKAEEPPCKLHHLSGCASCRDTTQDPVEPDTDEGWMTHKLVSEKDKNKDRMQRTESVDDYVVIDPRAREAKVAEEERAKLSNKPSPLGPAFRKRPRDEHHDSHRRDGRRYDRDYDHERRHHRDRDDDRRDRSRDRSRERTRSRGADDDYRRRR